HINVQMKVPVFRIPPDVTIAAGYACMCGLYATHEVTETPPFAYCKNMDESREKQGTNWGAHRY
ncbi:MAG: hypothetical protein Q7J12_08355, partial [Syntrophales bacterium]|nr:hypothetical protein [Syntrophales bacterium]